MKIAPFFIALIMVCTLAAPSYSQEAPSKLRVGGQVGVVMPSGDFDKTYGTGFGLHAEGKYTLMEKVLGFASLGYYSFSHNTNNFYLDGSLSVIPFSVGAQYEFGEADVKPYAGAEVSLNFISSTYKVFQNLAQVEKTSSETDLGFALAAGIHYPITPTITLDGSVRYRIISGDTIDFTHLGIYVGALIPIAVNW